MEALFIMRKPLFLLFVGCLLLQPLFGQNPFPDRCLGIWKGMMHIQKDGNIRDSVEVVLTVAKTQDSSAWTWKTEYLSKTMPIVKDYRLRLKNKEKNQYCTDEGEGLELLDYLFGNKLYCVFETGGVMLTSSYELLGDELIFEVTSGKKQPVTHPEVTNYSVSNLQRVVFKRVR